MPGSNPFLMEDRGKQCGNNKIKLILLALKHIMNGVTFKDIYCQNYCITYKDSIYSKD